MFRVFNLRYLGLITLISFLCLPACGKKERRDKATAPVGYATFISAEWTLDSDWIGAGLKIKDIKP